MRFQLSQLWLALAVGGLALAVNAQPAGNTSTGNATTTAQSAGASAGTAAQTSGTHSATTHRASRHRAATHANRRARGERRTQMASEANGPDSAYKAALRRCVTGPQSSRESCLDEAITQYGGHA